MPHRFDFESLRALIARSRQLKKDAALINAEALTLDAQISESLAALRSEIGNDRLKQLEAEIGGPETSKSSG